MSEGARFTGFDYPSGPKDPHCILDDVAGPMEQKRENGPGILANGVLCDLLFIYEENLAQKNRIAIGHVLVGLRQQSF